MVGLVGELLVWYLELCRSDRYKEYLTDQHSSKLFTVFFRCCSVFLELFLLFTTTSDNVMARQPYCWTLVDCEFLGAFSRYSF